MAYPERLLGRGEEIEFNIRPHWKALVLPTFWLIAIFAAAAWVITRWTTATDGTSEQYGLYIIIGASIGGIVWLSARPFTNWVTTHYIFTNRRIMTKSGLIARQGRDLPLAMVANVSYDVSITGRLMNFGTLVIESTGDEDLIIHDVPNCEAIQSAVYRLHDEDDHRRRHRPELSESSDAQN